MAQFYGTSFNFAGESSYNYDLYIVEFGGSGGWQSEQSGGGVEIVSDAPARQAEHYIYGVRNSGIQKFSITFGSDTPKDAAENDRILAWLFQMQPCWLHIHQDDMSEFRYFGVFTEANSDSLGKLKYGLTLTFESRSPYAYTFPRTVSLDITKQTKYVFNNISGDRDYLYPEISITPTIITQSFIIVNENDNGRVFRFDFKPVSNGKEIISVNNKLLFIQSSLGYAHSRIRLENFNMNWLRFVRGQNVLDISGAAHVEITCRFPKRVGN